MGKRNPDDWVLEDFGNIKLPEPHDKDFQWHLQTVKRKYSQNPKRLFNKLRNMYPNLRCVEENNSLNTNLQVAIELIANLRHQIVHTRGQVESLEDFSKNILNKWELSRKLANSLAPTRIYAIMLAIVSGRQDMSKSGPGRADREGLSIVDLFKMFPDDATAEAWFEEQRWPGEQRCCPDCGSINYAIIANRKPMPYRCRDCREHFSVRKGTVMQSSKLRNLSTILRQRRLGFTEQAEASQPRPAG